MNIDKVFCNTRDFKITDETLGKGSFGTVYIAECISDHSQCAAKVINISSDFDGKDQMMIIRESSILSNLNHQAIIKYYGVSFRSLKDMTIFQPTIITEYMPNKSLKEILAKEKLGLSNHNWNPTKKYISLIGIANAMKYLHERDILHRDLKPENILMDKDYYPKICDFGLSRILPKLFSLSSKMVLTGKIGTPLYMAPEMIIDDKEKPYGKGVDVYAFGMLAYEIVTGKSPFYELGEKVSVYKLYDGVLKGNRPTFSNDVPKKMQDLISKCWSQDEKDRPTFEDIFDALSTDFSYSPEDIDEEEVNDYLESIRSDNKCLKEQIEDNHEIHKNYLMREEKFKKELEAKSEEISQLKKKIEMMNSTEEALKKQIEESHEIHKNHLMRVEKYKKELEAKSEKISQLKKKMREALDTYEAAFNKQKETTQAIRQQNEALSAKLERMKNKEDLSEVKSLEEEKNLLDTKTLSALQDWDRWGRDLYMHVTNGKVPSSSREKLRKNLGEIVHSFNKKNLINKLESLRTQKSYFLRVCKFPPSLKANITLRELMISAIFSLRILKNR